MASTFFNVGSVTVGLALGFSVGRSFGQGLIVCMAFGVVAGGALQLAWQIPAMRRSGFAFRPRLNFSDPGVRRIGRLMLPAFLGNAAVQINVMVNTNFASNITDASGHVINGPVSWLGYAFRFMQLPLGLFGVAIASATLPALSRSAAVERLDDFRGTLAESLGTMLLLTIPSSFGLAVMGESMIAAVYQWGRFTAHDSHETAIALACYSAGLAGYSAIKILAPAFYALGSGRVPMLVSVASIAINFASAWANVVWMGMGHAGLALSTSLVALVGAAVLFAVLGMRLGGLHAQRLAITAGKVLTASAAMAIACRESSVLIHAAAGEGKLAQLADVAISIPLGVAIFYGIARLLRVEELEALQNACYTSIRNAPRPAVGDPPTRNR